MMKTQLELAVDTAIETCLGHDAETHREMAIALAPDGTEILRKQGVANHVGFNFLDMLEMQLSSIAVLVHNHPINVSLSSQDILMATKLNCEIIAVCADGGIYRSKGIKNPDAYTAGQADTMNDLTNTLINRTLATSPKNGDFCLSHLINDTLNKAGFLASYDYVLGTEQAAKLVELELERTHNVDATQNV